VQDLLFTFLKLEFDEVRKEESTPSYAGTTSKIDIVLKNENRSGGKTSASEVLVILTLFHD